MVSMSVSWNAALKLAFHDADTDTDTGILAYDLQ